MPSMGRGGVRLGLLPVVTMNLAWIMFAGSGLEAAAEGNASSEYQVKAAFLFHFAQFVDWPPEAFKDAGSPLTYFVERLPAQFVASHKRLDSQLTWHLKERAELSVVGQNLLEDHHVEFNDQFQSVNSSQIKRSAYAKFTWRF
jgi:hypothetical protein